MFTKEFIEVHNKIKNTLKKNIKGSNTLLLYLEVNYLETLKLIEEYIIEGYLFTYDTAIDEHSIIRDKLFKKPDKYNKRKLKLGDIYQDETLKFWDSLGINSRDKVILYFEYNETFLEELFTLCSPPEIFNYSNCKGINNMKNKFKNKNKNIIGIFIDTVDKALIFDSFLSTKLKLYDLSIQYGNLNNTHYLEDLYLQGLIFGVPPLENIEHAQSKLNSLKML